MDEYNKGNIIVIGSGIAVLKILKNILMLRKSFCFKSDIEVEDLDKRAKLLPF